MRLLVATKTMRADALIYCLFEGQRPTVEIEKLYVKADFSGKEKEQLMVYTGKPAQPRVILIGLGKEQKDQGKRNAQLREAAARIVGALSAHKLKNAVLSPLSKEDLAVLAGGLLIADYRFREYQPKKAKEEVRIEWLGVPDLAASGLREIEQMAESVNWARDLVNHPSNTVTPRHLARHFAELRRLSRVKVQVLGRSKLQSLRAGLILAVSQGSTEEPFLVISEYRPPRPKNTQPYVFVGKGVTFDTGGLNIKPTDGMGDMKIDMAGSAAAFGALRAAALLKLPYHVIAIAPLVENMVSGKSLKPGDVVKSMKGLTVEIDNTDAEGRLVLADALHYAMRYKPKAVIDLATLTGACMIALGLDTAGAFSWDERLPSELRKAGETIGEYVWPMPMEKRHEEFIKSDLADIGNNKCPRGRIGGAIEGAIFLSKFVDEKTPWVHLDIAGPADTKKPYGFYREPGATGFGVRLLIAWLRQQ